MLKKLLTTIIVLAATATAWAEGYGYTLDKDGARATITTGNQTLKEVIADIKGLTPTVQYIILPDGMKKAEVNSIATANGFVVAVSKNEATKTEAKWVYTYNGEEFIYEGTPTTTDGVSTANVKVLVDLTETKFSYTLNGQPYNGTVFFDAQGNCYGVQDANDVFDLTKKQGYTYNNGTTEYTGKVAEVDGKYYGVIYNPTEVALDLSHPVSWTYDNGKYAHLGEVYNNGTNIFYQGGTEYPLTTKTRYTYDDNGSKKLYPENGLTRTADNKTFGWVGGTQVSLTQKDAWFNGTTLYTGAIRKEGETTFGNTDKPYNLSQESVYTYTDNGTKKWYKGAIRDVKENGVTTYYGNSSYENNIEEYPLTEKEGNTYTLNNVTKEYSGLVRTDSEGKSWGNTGEQFPITKQEGKYTYDNYGTKTIYEGTVYKKVADNTYWGIWSGTEIELEEKKNAYTYKLNSWSNDKAVYTGATRMDANGKIYGNTGVMPPLTTTTTAPWTYDNGKYIYEGEYISVTNGNVGGTFYELQTITATAETPVYTFTINDADHGWNQITYCSTDVKEETGQWGNVIYKLNDGTVVNATKNTSGEFKYYNKPADALNYVYTGTVYTKFDGTGQYACEGGTSVAITKAAGNVNYYTDTDNKKVVYTGNVYTDNDNKEYGVKDANKDVELTKEDVIVRSDNNSIYTAEKYYKVGTESLVGIEYPNIFALEYGTIYIKADKSIYTGEYYRDDKGNYYGYDGTEVLLTNGKYYLKDNGDVYSNKVFYYLKEDKSKSFVGYSYISDVVITEGEEYLYTKEEQQLLYTGKVYHKQGDENIYIGFENQYNEITLTSAKAYFYTPDGGEETQYTAGVYTTVDDKTVGFVGGGEKELTHGEVKYYTTKDEQTVIAKDNTRISLDGDTYCVGGNAYNLMQKEEGYTANLYTDSEGRSVIYTGKVYDIATGYIGGNEIKLAYGDIYFNGENIYTGHRNADNTKGCKNAQNLDALFTYTYTNPNNGEPETFTNKQHLTTKEVDYTATVEQKEIEVPTGKIHLIAYVSIPGSLYYAIGDKRFGGADLTAVTLSGSLNAADIASHDGMRLTGNGHAIYKTYPNTGQETDNEPIVPADDNAMPGIYPAFANTNLLTYIDLSDAVFNVQTDMQIANMAHGVNGLKTVFLPTNEKMTEIPAHCLWGANGIEEICIPYNYEKIGAEAFYNTSISHFYTTDAAGNIITNGPNTITFSENLRIIETSNNHVTFSGSGANKITDVYVMRYNPEDTEYPTTQCQPNAFQASMLCGNKGNAGDMAHPIQRSNYKNQGMWFAVLHYPQDIEEEYEKMYTDITRVYTLKDETGLVDGKGKAYVWPTHGQLGQAYTTVVEKKTNFEGTAYDQEFLAKHSGWLEFVLTGKSNTRDYDPQTENTEFVYRDWLAICVPYDLKKSQLLSILGVDPRVSEGGVDEVTTLKNEVITTTTPLYPDVRALTHVSRSVNNGKMILHFAKLVEQDGESVKCYDVEISKMNGVENEHGQGFTKTELTDDDPIVMKGGHPYLIRAYVPAAWNDKIKNLGMYIMSAASSANHAAIVAGKEEPYKYGACTVQADGGDMYLPCLKHKVHAFDADAGHGTDVTQAIVGEGSSDFVYNTGNDDPALYHFVGTYYDTKIPQYAYYIGKATDGHKFTRSTRPLESAYTWAPYTAVIVGLANPEYKDLNDHAANETDELKNIVPEVNNGNDLVILAHEAGKYNKQAGARLSLGGFSDSTITGIVDVNIDENVNISNNKVYSINGQYMGTSLNNLPKGIYIINGQKKVVK